MTNFVTHPLIKPQAIERREYQEAILVQCLTENSLVVVPTGLGKTILAALLAVAKLNENPDQKIVFLAPTKPLAAQHQRVFQEVLTVDPDFLNLFTGSIPPDKRENLWKDTTVAFMTPQVFQNDIIARRVNLTEVALVVFDEAHRAVGDYAYTFIAEKYAAAVPGGQILGITASPGGNVDKIEEVVQNLHVTHVEVRTDESPDVRPYVHDIKVEWKLVTLPRRFQQLRELFTEQLRGLYKVLKHHGFLKSEVPDNVTRVDLLKAQRTIQKEIQNRRQGVDASPLFNSIKATSNAIRISHALELIETQGVTALGKYLQKMTREAQASGASGSLKGLVGSEFMASALALTKKLHKEGVTHPKMVEMVEIVREELARRPDSRVMVFVQYRDTVTKITKVLEKSNKGPQQTTLGGNLVTQVKPVRFVGQGDRKGDKGLSQRQQIEILEQFRAGEFNVLVATSVAEEGLDVSECDLVVFYDVVPSEIRTIQRRGRTGRRKTGRVVVLIAKDTRDEGYYWAARAKEKKMRETLKAISEGQQIVVGPGPQGASRQEEQQQLENPPELTGDNSEEKKPPAEELGEDSDVELPDQGDPTELVVDFQYRPDTPTVIVDHRETASPVVKELDLLGAHVELNRLPTADYIVSPRIGIERKSGRDFVDSIKDGRLFGEIVGLTAHFDIPVLILEGNPLEVSAMAPAAILGALATLVAKFKVHLIQTRDAADTARHVHALARAAQKRRKKDVPIRLGKAAKDPNEVVELLISRVPGFNRTRARKLLAEFGTLRAVFTAEVGALKRVEGIGPKLAREVKRISTHPYRPPD